MREGERERGLGRVGGWEEGRESKIVTSREEEKSERGREGGRGGEIW